MTICPSRRIRWDELWVPKSGWYEWRGMACRICSTTAAPEVMRDVLHARRKRIIESMSLPVEPSRRYTVEEYLELEGNSPQEKYEYREGIIVNMREALAMAGAAPVHVLIATNTAVALSNQLRGGPCRAYVSDLRVRIPRKTLYTYPDVTVVCGEGNFESHRSAGATLTDPRLIVEVLSPSTELYDRGDKFSLYREIPSLAEYVLVSQAQPRVERYFRHDDGGWAFYPYEGLGQAVKLLSLNIELPLQEIYAGVEFPPEEPAAANP